MKTKKAKENRYGWTGQKQGSNVYALYTGVTDDPYKRYMTGLAYGSTDYFYSGEKWYANEVEEFYLEKMPKIPKNFKYDEKMWESFNEQIQIDSIYIARMELEEKGLKVRIVNRNEGIGSGKYKNYVKTRRELYRDWILSRWLEPENKDIKIWREEDNVIFYSKKIKDTAVKGVTTDADENKKTKKLYLQKKLSSIAAQKKEIEKMLKTA